MEKNGDQNFLRPLGHYLLDSCFSSENFQDGMRAGGSLPLPIIHILSFYYENLVK